MRDPVTNRFEAAALLLSSSSPPARFSRDPLLLRELKPLVDDGPLARAGAPLMRSSRSNALVNPFPEVVREILAFPEADRDNPLVPTVSCVPGSAPINWLRRLTGLPVDVARVTRLNGPGNLRDAPEDDVLETLLRLLLDSDLSDVSTTGIVLRPIRPERDTLALLAIGEVTKGRGLELSSRADFHLVFSLSRDGEPGLGANPDMT